MNYIISFVNGNRFFQKSISNKENVTIGSSTKDNFIISNFKSSQITIKNSHGFISAESKKPINFDIKKIDYMSMHVVDVESRSLLYIDKEKTDFPSEFELPHNASITIGRSDKCNVVIDNKYISSTHCVISRENGIYYVEDKGSTNGTYLNSLRVTKAKFETGDEIHVFTYTIKLSGGKLKITNAGNDVSVNSLPENNENKKSTIHVAGERPIYQRSPRTQEELPKEDIVLAAPPTKGQKWEKGRGMFSSIASSAAMVGSSLAMGVASPAMLAARSAMLIMPATSIASSTSANKRNKKKANSYEKLREARFAEYLDEQRARINSVITQQRKIISDENPSPVDCYSIAKKLNRNLWERSPLDRDFLDVRLGMGYEEICVKIKDRGEAYGVEIEDDDAKELSEMLVQESKYVDDIPVRVSLAKNSTVGVIGDRNRVIQQVLNMVTELTTLHCYTDVRIVGIFDNDEYKEWESLKWLPHIWDEKKQARFLAFDKDSAHSICETFNDMLKQRARELNGNQSFRKDGNVPIPYYIFILGSKSMMEDEEIMSNLTTNDPRMGVTSLFLFDDIYSLPPACEYIIDMQENPMAYWKNKLNSKFIFSIDKCDKNEFDVFTRRLSSVELKGYAVQADIPSSVTFLQGYGVKTVEDLGILERWNINKTYKSLIAPIGVLSGEKTQYLDIHDEHGVAKNVHGPHGLVAGTTGSGKSELLQTWILSVCVNYHPHDVNFVLIDYKGGGMANTLEAMPHIVGKITNIGSNIKRSIVSLNQENKRRMAMFEQAGVNHIDDYQKLYYEGRVSEPMPHLIIVADEFAELKKENPDFIRNLVSVAVVGRALGIHLVLATQKPSGIVDDQIEANTRLRLCLKVQSVGDSREMLKTPDAAMITQAGRAYMKIGNGEYYEQFQSYWSGAPYLGDSAEKVESGNSIRIVGLNGERIKTVTDEKTRFKSEVDELKAINNYICRLSKENGIERLQGPWLEELPEQLSFEIVRADVQGGYDGQKWNPTNLDWLKVPIGKFDCPELQQQGVLCLDFASDGHYGVYGTSASGKTNLLKTMMSSLCSLYTPEDVNVYIIDCGGWSMSAYKDMPHVADVILDTEEEKFEKFKNLINDEINARRKLFLENVVSSLSAYRQSVGKLPAIIVAIDNIIPIFDLYPDMEDVLVRIAREGVTYGIYMIYTANSTSGVRFKVLQNIKGAVAFELTDRGDYPTIVGRMEGKSIPTTPGRGFLKTQTPLDFQCAIYADGQDEIERSNFIKAISQEMSQNWDGPMPNKVPVMPELIDSNYLTKNYKNRAKIPLGIRFENIKPAYVDLTNTYCFLVTGSIGKGKSSFLSNIINAINNDDNMIYIFDSEQQSLEANSSIAKGYCCDNDAEMVSAKIAEIVEMLNDRQRNYNVAKDEAGFDPIEFSKSKKQICVFIDDINEFVNYVDNESRDMMDNIARLAKNLGVLFVAAGRTADVSRLSDIERLTSTVVKVQKGLAIDGSPAQYPFFVNKLSYSERDVDCGDGNAWLFDNGNCEKIKIK